MIEPTKENIALFILSRGFCTNCGGAPSDMQFPSEYFCSTCWAPVFIEVENYERGKLYGNWRHVVDAWREAFRKHGLR